MSQANSFTPPPPVPPGTELAQGSTVRRHHTISNPSRIGGRTSERQDSGEFDEYEDDEDHQWTGGSALASEKQASLQRNLSLPSKYHRAMRDQPGMPPNSVAHSQSMGGLSSGPEEDEWSGVAATMYEVDEEDQLPTSQTNPENMNASAISAGAGAVRRHVSMTDGQKPRRGGGLSRYPTMSAGRPPIRSSTMNATTEAPEDHSAAYAEAEPEAEYDESLYPSESAYGGIQGNTWDPTTGDDPNWRNNAPGAADWRQGQQAGNVDELTNTLGSLDLQPSQQPNYARGGPRFEAASGGYQDHYAQLQGSTGPVSASAFIPQSHVQRESVASLGSGEGHHRTASGGEWDQKGRILKGRGSNPNIGQGYQGQYGGGGGFGNMPPPPPIPAQYLNQMQSGRLMSGGNAGYSAGAGQQFGALGQQAGVQQQPPLLDPTAFLASPIDVPTMIAQKGYNPATFDTKPPFARYFVIKSYTEDDVHKSLKYEIWSSTDPGNKRLDKAFRECAGRGPIYLFFSVNASGHFCGMAEMLTPVDYTRSSTVWASDKWKGVFKVRWVFVRDIPNAVLRNIRLNNTQERKPVTNSRDTQELLPEAGHEMLRIFFTHPAKTSLLQDFAFYELQSLQKQQQQQQQAAMGSPPQTTSSPPGMASPQQVSYTIGGQQHVPYGQGNQPGLGNAMLGSMSMPMGVGHLGMQGGGPQYGNAMGLGVGPQVAQSVLRGSSPGPIGSGIPGNYSNTNSGGGGANNSGNGAF